MKSTDLFRVEKVPRRIVSDSFYKCKRIGQTRTAAQIDCGSPGVKSNRRLLNASETAQLEAEYIKDRNWTRQTMHSFAHRLGISKAKVYKWHYDRKKKEEREDLLLLRDMKENL